MVRCACRISRRFGGTTEDAGSACPRHDSTSRRDGRAGPHRGACAGIRPGWSLSQGREPEERKLALLAAMLANIAFREDVDRALAHTLTRTAEQLS